MEYQYPIRLETNQHIYIYIYITYCLLLKLVYDFAATPSHCLLLHDLCMLTTNSFARVLAVIEDSILLMFRMN